MRVGPGIVDARVEGAWRTVAGLTVVGRILRTLEAEGVSDIVVVSAHEPSDEELGRRRLAGRPRLLCLAPDQPLAGVAGLDGETVLYVRGNLVVDRRLIRTLVTADRPTVVRGSVLGDQAVALGRLPLAWLDGADPGGVPADCVDPGELPVFSEEMRGPAPILLLRVTDEGSAREASRAVIKATQKHVMDAPARWLDPFFENAIVDFLAPTRVTPNQVTYACTILGFVAAGALLRGSFLMAFPLMYVVEWLDGVDGKLARTRLEYSTVGEWESYFDFAYENAWWLALTLWFYGSADPTLALAAGVALIGGNLLDEIAYTLGHAWLGTALDLLSRKDAAFRLIAGRRNIYTAILLVAFLCGNVFGGFIAAGGWAVLTGAVHFARLLTAAEGRRKSAGLLER